MTPPDTIRGAGWQELRREIEALPDDCHDPVGLLCERDEQGRCTPVNRAAVLAIVDRLMVRNADIPLGLGASTPTRHNSR